MNRRTPAFIILFALVAGGCVQGETTIDITSATAAARVAATTSSTTAPMTPPTSKLSNGCDRELATPGEHEGIGRSGELAQPYWAVVSDSYADMAPVPLYMHLAAADPGQLLETHDREGNGPVTAVACAPRPFMRVASVVPDKGELGVCH